MQRARCAHPIRNRRSHITLTFFWSAFLLPLPFCLGGMAACSTDGGSGGCCYGVTTGNREGISRRLVVAAVLCGGVGRFDSWEEVRWLGPSARHASQPLPLSNNRLIGRCRSRGQCQPNHALDRLTFYADEQTAAAAGFRSRCPTTAASSTQPHQPTSRPRPCLKERQPGVDEGCGQCCC